MKNQVTFLGEKCEVVFGQYTNGRIAIQLICCDDGSPMATATVNLPDEYIYGNGVHPYDAVFIKDYSENAGMVKALQEAGMLGECLGNVQSGWVTIPCYDLNRQGLEEWEHLHPEEMKRTEKMRCPQCWKTGVAYAPGELLCPNPECEMEEFTIPGEDPHELWHREQY